MHASRRPHQCFETLGGDGAPALVADAVGVFFELLQRPVDLARDLVELACGHRPSHLQDRVGCVIAGALAELHLDPRRPNGLRELGQLLSEVLAARLEQRYELVSSHNLSKSGIAAPAVRRRAPASLRRYAAAAPITVIPRRPLADASGTAGHSLREIRRALAPRRGPG